MKTADYFAGYLAALRALGAIDRPPTQAERTWAQQAAGGQLGRFGPFGASWLCLPLPGVTGGRSQLALAAAVSFDLAKDAPVPVVQVGSRGPRLRLPSCWQAPAEFLESFEASPATAAEDFAQALGLHLQNLLGRIPWLELSQALEAWAEWFESLQLSDPAEIRSTKRPRTVARVIRSRAPQRRAASFWRTSRGFEVLKPRPQDWGCELEDPVEKEAALEECVRLLHVSRNGAESQARRMSR